MTRLLVVYFLPRSIFIAEPLVAVVSRDDGTGSLPERKSTACPPLYGTLATRCWPSSIPCSRAISRARGRDWTITDNSYGRRRQRAAIQHKVARLDYSGQRLWRTAALGDGGERRFSTKWLANSTLGPSRLLPRPELDGWQPPPMAPMPTVRRLASAFLPLKPDLFSLPYL